MVAGMTAQHTPEPWVAGFGLIEESEEMMFGIGLPTLPTWTPIAILSTQRKLNVTDTANAERIVTCVNACAGISNEALQQKGMSLLTDIIKNQQTTIESLRQQLASRDAEVAELRNELETERMRNVACGVVAMADTPDFARWALDMHPDYMSASCSNVARRVDECIKLREQVTLLRGAIGNIKNYAHKTDDVLRWCDEAIAATEPRS